MRFVSTIGWLLIGAGGMAAWAALLGALVPSLDAFASFMPVFAGITLAGAALAVLAGRRRGRALICAAIAVAPVALSVVPELLRVLPRAAPDTPRVRVLTHNVWVDNSDPAETAQVIVDAHPDIVLLQEVDGNFRPMLAALRQHFPHATDCPRGCALAIFSRWPILDRDYFLRDAAGRKRGPPLLWARVAVPGMAPVLMMTAHYPWPLPAAAQARRRADMARALARIDRDGLILAGDMNLTPWSAAMRAQDRAFAPLTRFTRGLASWRRPIPLLPIDQLYAGPDWGLVDARRLSATGSDHYPLLVTLGRR